MGALQLDAVEAAAHAVLGDERVAGHDLGDLVGLDCFGYLPEKRVGHRAGRPDRQPGVHARGLPAVVVDLSQDRNAVGVDGFGDPSVAGDDFGVETVDELLVRPVRGMGRVLLGDDQPGASGSPGLVIGGVLFARPAVLGGVVGQVGGEHDPVAQRERTDSDRGEEMPVLARPAHTGASTTAVRAEQPERDPPAFEDGLERIERALRSRRLATRLGRSSWR